ncbi:hypothetical protein Tco_0754401 [Tanacetum coccineum]
MEITSEEKGRLCWWARDKEIEELKSQLLKAKEESVEVAQLRARVSGLEATEGSLRGEVASAKEHNGLLEQECDSLKSKVTSLESNIAEKDFAKLETSSTELCEKLEMYEGSLKRLEEFQDNLMRPLETRLAEIDADFTRCFSNVNEYMEALGHAFGRAIEKGMQEGLAAGIEHGQAGRCLTDLEAYIPLQRYEPLSAEALIEPPVEAPATNLLSTVVIVPHSDPPVSVEDYDNPDLADVVPENVTPRPEGEEKIDALARGDLTFSQLDDEARDAIL